MDWNLNLKRLMGEATQLVRSGQLADATRAIQQTLGAAVARHSNEPTPANAGAAPLQAPSPAGEEAPRWRSAAAAQDVEDAVVIDRSAPTPQAEPKAPTAPRPAANNHPLAEPPGSFTRVVFTHADARRHPHHYHLYVPPGATAGTPMPLVLMLHGCTQNPVDFATGTGMNDAAAPANALVLYPEQPHSANPNGCWNWFRPGDQHRGSGEPALLVAMLQDVMARHPVDAQRVYVAGLSAGGAMAALLGREYPELFAAVGVHSGLQAGAAHNVMGALSAMKNGAKPGAATHATAEAPALPPPWLPPQAVQHRRSRPCTQASPPAGRATRAGCMRGQARPLPAGHCPAPWWQNTGCCTAQATRGRAGTRAAATPTHAAWMPRRRCCGFFWSIRALRGIDKHPRKIAHNIQ